MEKAYEQWAMNQSEPRPTAENNHLVVELPIRRRIYSLYKGYIQKEAAWKTAPENDRQNLGILAMLIADMFFYSNRTESAEDYYRYAVALLPEDNEHVARLREVIWDNWPQDMGPIKSDYRYFS